jgi:hypothetical protein
VPVGARIEEGGMWRQVEGDSGLEAGVIVGARWLKVLARRRAGQQSAHAKVEFATAEAANHTIDNSLYWQGKHIRVRKSEEEVRRCVKCQKFDGHLAFACKSTADVCGRCAEAHQTLDCSVTDSGPMRCSNCKVGGHGAASRTCPFFQSEQQKRNERDPTYGYRYIPTTDPRTWATTAGAAAAAAATAAPSVGHGRLAGGQPGQGSGVQADDGWRGRVQQPRMTAGNGWSADRLYQPTIRDAFSPAGRGRGASGGGRGNGHWATGSNAVGLSQARREEAPRNEAGMDIADREPGLSLEEQAAIRAVDGAHQRERDLQSQRSPVQTQTQGPAVPVGGTL